MDEGVPDRVNAALDAMEHHQRNVTYPILYDLGDQGLCVLGSGVLFACEKRHFVLTAAHLFDDDDDLGPIVREKLAGPNTRAYGIPTTFGPIELYIGQRPI